MIELIGGLIDTWWIVVSLASVGLAATIGAAAVFGVLGIAVTAVISLGLGIYFGYRYYHDKKCKHGVKADKELVDAQVLEIILASYNIGSQQIMREGLGGSILDAPYLDPVKDLSTNRGAGRGSSIEEQVDSEQAGTYNPQHSQTNQQRS